MELPGTKVIKFLGMILSTKMWLLSVLRIEEFLIRYILLRFTVLNANQNLSVDHKFTSGSAVLKMVDPVLDEVMNLFIY